MNNTNTTNKFAYFERPVSNIYPKENISIEDLKYKIIDESRKTQSDNTKAMKKEGKPKKDIQAYKAKNFDLVCPACIFDGTRAAKNISTMSGFASIDVDDIKTSVEELKTKLSKDPYCLLIFESPSGGLKILIKVPKDFEKYSEYVSAYYDYLQEEYGLTLELDKKTRDPARAMFISYDYDIKENSDSIVWDKINKPKEKKEEEKPFFKNYTENQLRAMLKYIPVRNAGDGLGNHSFTVMLGLIHYSKYRKKDYFPVFRWWNEHFNSGTTLEDLRKKWNEWFDKPQTDKPTTIKSIVFEAYEHGYKQIEKKVKDNIAKGLMRIENYMGNVEDLHKIQPFFYDKTKNFWFWDFDSFKYDRVDEIDLMNKLEEEFDLNGLTVNSKEKTNYLEAFKRVGRKHHPKEAPAKWIQFKDRAYSLSSGETHEVTPDYFFTNPIPWEIGESENIPTIDNLLKEWVGPEYKETLLEILSYCMYRDYPIHKIFCFIGSGSNGKGRFFALMRKLIGNDNCGSVDLDLLISSRFEQSKIYKKLICQMGETNFNTMSRTSRIKSLSGQDLVGFEFKGKDSIDAMNYAKILISTNTLPITTDQTDGFHRRWFNIRFPNKFSTTSDPISKIPDEEFRNLCKLCIRKLSELLEKNCFHNEKSVVEAKKEYEDLSNPLQKFIKEKVEFAGDDYIFKFEFFNAFKDYLISNGHREWSDREIGTRMKELDIEEAKKDFQTEKETKRYRAYVGIRWYVRLDRDVRAVTTHLLPHENEVNPPGQAGQVGHGIENDILRYINNHQEIRDNKTKAILQFGEDKINKLLEDGMIIEDKPNHLKVL